MSNFPALLALQVEDSRVPFHVHASTDIAGLPTDLVLQNDLRSAGWDGGGDLTAWDSTVTRGFMADSSAGRIQTTELYAGTLKAGWLDIGGVLYQLALSGSDLVVTGVTVLAGAAAISLSAPQPMPSYGVWAAAAEIAVVRPAATITAAATRIATVAALTFTAPTPTVSIT